MTRRNSTRRLAERGPRSGWIAALTASTAMLFGAGHAAAQEAGSVAAVDVETLDYSPEPTHVPKLELVATFGVLDRATSGTSPDHGYGQNGTAVGGIDLRLLFPVFDCSCELGHGPQLGISGSGATAFGIGDVDTSAFRHVIIDAGYVFRTELPCMASGNRRWFVTGTVGVTTLVADAGLGSRVANDVDRNLREAAADAYDHIAFGWRFGAVMDVHFGALIAGFGFDLREAYGIGTSLARTFALSGILRLGGEIRL